jgi:hypothetical protein
MSGDSSGAGQPAHRRSPDRKSWSRLGGIVVAFATLTMMVATEPRLAIVWDEGWTLIRLQRIRAWARAFADPPLAASRWRPALVAPVIEDSVRPPLANEIDTRTKLLSPRVLAWFWPFARDEPHGHPPFYALVALAGDLLTPGRAELARARLGTMIAFSLTAGALFAFLARRRGLWAAVAASGAWVLQPQLFGLGHYAHYDALLSSLWVGAILSFANAVLPAEPDAPPTWRTFLWVALYGILAGCAAGTKFTGWLLPVPFLAWSAMHRDRRGIRTVVVGGIVSLLTVYLVTPPWWGDPVSGITAFFRSNLTRGETLPIPTQFLGRVYETPNGSLPWYNTLVWTVMATPVGFLVLAAFGLAAPFARGTDRLASLAVTHWVFLLVLRALPHTPGHDGIRQFLPAFGCLALVAGVGGAWLHERWRSFSRAAILVALTEGVISTLLAMPVPLSYFSPLVGGLPGATRLGMEPTYYWDALTPSCLRWINQHTDPGRTIAFSATPASYFHLKATGKLRPGAFPYDSRDWQWYILQNRPGEMDEVDRTLVARYGGASVISSHAGVPLIWAFRRSEFIAASGSPEREAGPSRRAQK